MKLLKLILRIMKKFGKSLDQKFTFQKIILNIVLKMYNFAITKTTTIFVPLCNNENIFLTLEG